jgi:hypothetical protein
MLASTLVGLARLIRNSSNERKFQKNLSTQQAEGIHTQRCVGERPAVCVSGNRELPTPSLSSVVHRLLLALLDC